MYFEESYFQPQNRDGFQVSSLMKRCWAAQLEVLECFDRICKRHGIRYFLAYGTLLGAIRHKGFIPWDDDIDIWMLREDVQRMQNELTDDFLSEGLELVTPYSDLNYHNLCFRLINTRTIQLDGNFLKRYWLFPFMAGLDIFPLDYVPRDEQKFEKMKMLAVCANLLGQMWNNENVSDMEKRDVLKQLLHAAGYNGDVANYEGAKLWQLSDELCVMCNETDADCVANIPYYTSNPLCIFRKEWFAETVELPFENGCFPCPAGYKGVLEAEFGQDYMTPKRLSGDHQYPYYRQYHLDLLKLFEANGVPCPKIYAEL